MLRHQGYSLDFININTMERYLNYIGTTLIFLCFGLYISCQSKHITDLQLSKKDLDIMFLNPTDTIFLKGNKNTIIKIPPLSFVHKDNSLVNDSILFSFKEFYTRKDILLSGIDTRTNDSRILVSHGFIYIDAKDTKGNNLNIAKNKRIEIQFDTAFYDRRFLPEAFYIGDNNFLWQQDTSIYLRPILNEVRIAKFDNERGFAYTYIFMDTIGYTATTNKTGWINLDKVFAVIPEISSELNVTSSNKKVESVKLVLTDIRAVISTQVNNSVATFKGLPKGEKAIILAFGVTGGKPYLGFKEVVIGSNITTFLDVKTSVMLTLN
jgi:hypothetical protein